MHVPGIGVLIPFNLFQAMCVGNKVEACIPLFTEGQSLKVLGRCLCYLPEHLRMMITFLFLSCKTVNFFDTRSFRRKALYPVAHQNIT